VADLRIERLDPGHVRAGFDCGKTSLNDFLLTLVSQYEKRNLGRTYVATDGGDRRVLGYYTLSSGSINVGNLPAKQAKKLPRHAVPVVLLARLAVDQRAQGKGVGGFLLRDGMTRSLTLSDELGIHAIVVDAIDEQAKAFYERYGFVPLADQPLCLYLPLATIRKASNPG
jgi:GNAT superfamily N-acetyltransferase